MQSRELCCGLQGCAQMGMSCSTHRGNSGQRGLGMGV